MEAKVSNRRNFFIYPQFQSTFFLKYSKSLSGKVFIRRMTQISTDSDLQRPVLAPEIGNDRCHGQTREIISQSFLPAFAISLRRLGEIPNGWRNEISAGGSENQQETSSTLPIDPTYQSLIVNPPHKINSKAHLDCLCLPLNIFGENVCL